MLECHARDGEGDGCLGDDVGGGVVENEWRVGGGEEAVPMGRGVRVGWGIEAVVRGVGMVVRGVEMERGGGGVDGGKGVWWESGGEVASLAGSGMAEGSRLVNEGLWISFEGLGR